MVNHCKPLLGSLHLHRGCMKSALGGGQRVLHAPVTLADFRNLALLAHTGVSFSSARVVGIAELCIACKAVPAALESGLKP